MADTNKEYSQRHIGISNFANPRDYVSPAEGRTTYPARDRAAHAVALLQQVEAVQVARQNRNIEVVSGFSPEDAGTLIEVESAPNKDLPKLERTGKTDIRVGAVRELANGAEQATLILPAPSLATFTTRIETYRDEDTPKGNPRLQDVELIQEIRDAWIESLWTDPRPIPVTNEQIWWECWCFPDRTEMLQRVTARLSRVRVSEQRLYFPEMTVIPVFATRAQMERVLMTINAIAELRRATDSPSFYTREVSQDQRDWVDNMSDRIEGPEGDSPVVCLLDSGVNRGHPLLAPWLPEENLHAVDADWGTADDRDHGTCMAGLALYGDLTYPLGDTGPIVLGHQLESVKLIPPPGMTPTDKKFYGSITQSAIAIPESVAPERQRTFSLTITNEDVSGERPTSWSAALDQSAAGLAIGDEEGMENARLVVVSAGNVPDVADANDLEDPDEHPTEDPAQAWNVLTVGGFTDKSEIDPQDNYEDWSTYANAGERSPYSRASTDWPNSHTPIKPEVVFEAGNRALSPDGVELISGLDSLSLLSTGSKTQRLLDPFWATSAATAQAARLAAMIQSNYPDYWPETVRALIVHSANWSPTMDEELSQANKTQRRQLLRQFGYGIPSFDRALASANSDLALVAQSTMNPFKRVTGEGVKFAEAHHYDIPWPVSELERLENTEVKLKITLSYFVEPSPGQIAPVSPERYRSAGLRFAIKQAGEPLGDFYKRVNKRDREKDEKISKENDPNWLFGLIVSAGSLHCDTWVGPAIELADRGHIMVYPVQGWWRLRPKFKRYDREIRYALVVTLTSPEGDVDLYSEITTEIENRLGIDIET